MFPPNGGVPPLKFLFLFLVSKNESNSWCFVFLGRFCIKNRHWTVSFETIFRESIYFGVRKLGTSQIILAPKKR